MTNTPIPNIANPVANGGFSTLPFIDYFVDRDPTPSDVQYNVQKKWLNTTTDNYFILENFVSSNGVVTANWVRIGGSGFIETITGNTGGVINPIANNFNIVGDGTITSTDGNPATATLTINVSGDVATTYTANTGTATPALHNLNVLGSSGIATSASGSTVTITPGGTIATTYTTDSGVATPSANNLNIVGAGGITTSGSGSTVTITGAPTQDLHTARYIVGDLTKGANYTTVTAAYAAAVAAGAPQTVFLQDGTYTENITGSPGINLCSFGTSGTPSVQGTAGTPNVILKGTLSASFNGSMNIYGIQLQTNGAAAISVTGGNTTQLNFGYCSIFANNATGVTINSTTSVINFFDCTFFNGGTNSLWVETSSSGIDFENCVFSTNGTASASSMAVGRAVFQACDMHGVNITTTGTGSVFASSSYWQYGGQTLLTSSGTGTQEIYNCYLRSDAATALSIGAGTILNIGDTTIKSSAVNALTGAGTINSNNIGFTNSFVNNISTQNSLPVEKIYSPRGITFDNTNVLANYDTGTFTPTLTGATTAGTTTYSNQQGYYTRIGNLVCVFGDLTISAATGTGDVLIGNFPFTIKNQTNGFVAGSIFWQGSAGWTWPAGTTNISLLGFYNNTYAKVWGQGSGVSGNYVQTANAALQVAFNIVYQI